MGVKTRSINSQMWSLQVRNRFPEVYSERASIDHNHSGKVDIEVSSLDLAKEILYSLRAEETKTIEHLEEEEDA